MNSSDDRVDYLEDVEENDLDREWTSRQSRFHSLGYRDGLDAGKQSTVQEGFEAGFQEAVGAGYRCGLARGWTSAFTSLPESVQKLLLDDSSRVQLGLSQTTLNSISSEQACFRFYSNLEKCKTVAYSANDSSEQVSSSSGVSAVDEIERLEAELEKKLKSTGLVL